MVASSSARREICIAPPSPGALGRSAPALRTQPLVDPLGGGSYRGRGRCADDLPLRPMPPISGPIQPLAWGNAVAQPGGPSCLASRRTAAAALSPPCVSTGQPGARGRRRLGRRGRGRGGGFPRVSPGARTARRVAPGQSDRLCLRPQSPWRARQRWPRARGEALRLAAVALFAGRGPDGVWVSETRALRDPSRAELTATACPGCRPRARGGGPAPAALPRTELTGRGSRATGLGPAGCAALGS